MRKLIVLLALILIATAIAVVFAQSRIPANPVSVWIVEHGPDGVVNKTGYMLAFRYAFPAVYLEFVPDGDPIFRSGFEVVP